MAISFRSMDESTAEQWGVIGVETAKNQGRVADRVLEMLESLGEIVDGFATDQLTHCLQTATRAERDGADEEVVLASLCHDIGKAISVPNHPAIAAEILKPYVRSEVYDMIRVHQDFQGSTTTPTSAPAPRPARSGASSSSPTCSTSPSASPTSGTRRRSTRPTTRSRSSTSSPSCERCSPRPGCSSK